MRVSLSTMSSAGKLLLYYNDISIPSRAVRLLGSNIGVKLDLKIVKLHKGEHLKPDYLALNPQHTIPTLVDNGFALAESRAICTYLVNKYAPGHSLYPSCPQKRAVIDRYLYFDIGTLYRVIGDYFYPKILFGKEYDPEKEVKVKDTLAFLETFLGDQDYLTGKEPTLADLCIGCSLTMFEVTGYGFPSSPKTEAFYNRIKKLPHWDEVNAKGVQGFKDFIASKQ